jgi:hypothetical protein
MHFSAEIIGHLRESIRTDEIEHLLQVDAVNEDGRRASILAVQAASSIFTAINGPDCEQLAPRLV